jgi:hypothetical protein
LYLRRLRRRAGLCPALEQFDFEKVGLLGKDLLANSCREMLAGELCPPSSKHFKRKNSLEQFDFEKVGLL